MHIRPVSTVLIALSFISCGSMPQSSVSGRSDDRAQPGSLPIAELRAYLADTANHAPLVLEAPLGITTDLNSMVPADNPMTPAKVELGRQLYFDKRLSRDETISCATCHDPAKGWTDNLPVSAGIDGQLGGRSAPTVINRILGPSQFWDGRAASLEEQAVGPIGNPIEMGFTTAEAAARLNQIPGYLLQFERVFGGPADEELIGKAIAAFERTIVSGHSRYDYYRQAEPYFDWEPEDDEDPEFLAQADRILDLEYEHRMSDSAFRGMELFFDKANCSACHVGEDLTDEQFHNIGVGFAPDSEVMPDPGRSVVTGVEAEHGAFRTPSLRNIALTAPYMHDGGLTTLMQVVDHYDQGGHPNPTQSDKVFPLELTPEEKQDLVRFLEEALTGRITEVEVPRLP